MTLSRREPSPTDRPPRRAGAGPRARRKGRAGALVPTARARSLDGAERQCVVCRARRPRLALVQARGAVGPAGRHAYVCIAKSCLLAGLAAPDGAAALHAQAAQKLGELLGLARRAGQLQLGASAQLGQRLPAGATLLVASDVAARTDRQLPAERRALPHSAAELCRAVGASRPVAAVLIAAGRHATQAAYWQQVWYETGPARGRGTFEVGDE